MNRKETKYDLCGIVKKKKLVNEVPMIKDYIHYENIEKWLAVAHKDSLNYFFKIPNSMSL